MTTVLNFPVGTILGQDNPLFQIVLNNQNVKTGVYQSGEITVPLHRETCPCCEQPGCYFDCDGSKAEDSPENEDDAMVRIKMNSAIDGLEAVLLALAIEGVNLTGEKASVAMQTTIDAIANNIA